MYIIIIIIIVYFTLKHKAFMNEKNVQKKNIFKRVKFAQMS